MLKITIKPRAITVDQSLTSPIGWKFDATVLEMWNCFRATLGALKFATLPMRRRLDNIMNQTKPKQRGQGAKAIKPQQFARYQPVGCFSVFLLRVITLMMPARSKKYPVLQTCLISCPRSKCDLFKSNR